jgi:hypothetical protein
MVAPQYFHVEERLGSLSGTHAPLEGRSTGHFRYLFPSRAKYRNWSSTSPNWPARRTAITRRLIVVGQDMGGLMEG